MNPDTLVYVAILGAHILGWVGYHVCIHRPDRANRQKVWLADLADRDARAIRSWAEIARLRTMLASAEADVTEAERKLAGMGRVADDTARIMHDATTAIQRRHWLPTIEGNYLDLVESLPVGFRLDLGWNVDETPIGASVVDALADVVPIGGAR